MAGQTFAIDFPKGLANQVGFPSVSGALEPLLDLSNHLNLNASTQGNLRHTKRAACMGALVAKYLAD